MAVPFTLNTVTNGSVQRETRHFMAPYHTPNRPPYLTQCRKNGMVRKTLRYSACLYFFLRNLPSLEVPVFEHVREVGRQRPEVSLAIVGGADAVSSALQEAVV